MSQQPPPPPPMRRGVNKKEAEASMQLRISEADVELAHGELSRHLKEPHREAIRLEMPSPAVLAAAATAPSKPKHSTPGAAAAAAILAVAQPSVVATSPPVAPPPPPSRKVAPPPPPAPKAAPAPAPPPLKKVAAPPMRKIPAPPTPTPKAPVTTPIDVLPLSKLNPFASKAKVVPPPAPSRTVVAVVKKEESDDEGDYDDLAEECEEDRLDEIETKKEVAQNLNIEGLLDEHDETANDAADGEKDYQESSSSSSAAPESSEEEEEEEEESSVAEVKKAEATKTDDDASSSTGAAPAATTNGRSPPLFADDRLVPVVTELSKVQFDSKVDAIESFKVVVSGALRYVTFELAGLDVCAQDAVDEARIFHDYDEAMRRGTVALSRLKNAAIYRQTFHYDDSGDVRTMRGCARLLLDELAATGPWWHSVRDEALRPTTRWTEVELQREPYREAMAAAAEDGPRVLETTMIDFCLIFQRRGGDGRRDRTPTIRTRASDLFVITGLLEIWLNPLDYLRRIVIRLLREHHRVGYDAATGRVEIDNADHADRYADSILRYVPQRLAGDLRDAFYAVYQLAVGAVRQRCEK